VAVAANAVNGTPPRLVLTPMTADFIHSTGL
jgi:hypothetical protein